MTASQASAFSNFPVLTKWKTFLYVECIQKYLKHVLHCALMLSCMFLSVFAFTDLNTTEGLIWTDYGTVLGCLMYAIRYLAIFVPMPHDVFIFFGLFLYNAFPGPIKLEKKDLDPYPFICFRVTTKGTSQNLVRSTVQRNLKLILEHGIKKFKVQILTDVFVRGVTEHPAIEQVVVPNDYQPKSGAIFKSRCLQYVIEKDALNVGEWIVNLDEETLLTKNSLNGILNFIDEGKCHIGQGLITYANYGSVVNWITTLVDSTRVADDMGKLRFQFNLFKSPLLSMKGAYTVVEAETERKIGFDNGLEGSIAEDCYFVMKGYDQGYTFGFIEGEMHEFSPFTLRDFVLQRKRWFQGIFLVVYSGAMTFKTMFWLTIDFHKHILLSVSLIFALKYFTVLLPVPFWIQVICHLGYGLRIYMYVFGILKTADLSDSPKEKGALKLCFSLLLIVVVRPIHIVMDILATVLGIWHSKYGFYLVKKEV